MTAESVLTEVAGDITTVTLNRPERSNALDSPTARALADAIDHAQDARVTILTGAGRAFCAGGDLEELERWTDLAPEEIGQALYEGYQGMIRAIRRSPSIVIAAINGAAVGAGLDLALACDLRVASDDAKLGQVWVGLGVIPGTGGAWLTQALAGPTRAAELLLTGRVITADEAFEAGLLNAVVPAGEVMDKARQFADDILKHPRAGVVANKRAIVAATEAALEDALDHARAVQPERFTSEEFREALRARRSRS
jgi:2-(1,2-epoxy-1,2-dihydrophenyl)acetyl-CoA isomerase